ncbi:FAD dependent oxidoreductase [Schizopora paradoxa]|uniref:L-2-hydroxyglutarate dehydrogenase, mitochondrial n=1 Tax=Schizopora paradoxa TaxID=27342 RepID=A0A0H2RXN0_9AGAM|nr:FAD dependent oxidoreductase [Schizopora paradoxa]
MLAIISSRNSEVIHAGIYYPPGSLKQRLCVRGRHLLYEYCKESSVPFRKTEKLVVAKEYQRSYIESLHKKCNELSWPTSFHSDRTDDLSCPAVPTELISGAEARQLEPDISPDIAAALLSRETGIIDSHTYMESLERDIAESNNGELAFSTTVVRVDPYDPSKMPSTSAEYSGNGWVVQTVTGPESPTDASDALVARTIINSSGLNGALVLNSLLEENACIPMYYAKGSYAAYNGPGVGNVRRLIYPCAETSNKDLHSFQSLGTHLTLDLNGNVRFGPNIEWISPDITTGSYTQLQQSGEHEDVFIYDAKAVDFWKRFLVPDESQLSAMYRAVREYLPGVVQDKFRADYVGIRPKLVPPWAGFQDFVFREDNSFDFLRSAEVSSRDREGGKMITLLGIESPGLTSSLAIAEKVVGMLEGHESRSE